MPEPGIYICLTDADASPLPRPHGVFASRFIGPAAQAFGLPMDDILPLSTMQNSRKLILHVWMQRRVGWEGADSL